MSLLPLCFISLEEGSKDCLFFFFLHAAFRLLKKVCYWYYVTNSIWMTLIVQSHFFLTDTLKKLSQTRDGRKGMEKDTFRIKV